MINGTLDYIPEFQTDDQAEDFVHHNPHLRAAVRDRHGVIVSHCYGDECKDGYFAADKTK